MKTKRITAKYIKEYIKHLFGLNVEIKIVHHFWGRYGAYAWRGDKNSKHLIKIAKSVLEYDDYLKALIWHEVGHLFTSEGFASAKNEINAQAWAMKEMKKRGYNKLYQYSLTEMVERWVRGDIGCEKKRMYKKAGKEILKVLGEK